jgi:cold shock protein
MKQVKGTVKWWDDRKGYGFIKHEGTGQSIDVFVHYTAIMGEGFKTLQENEVITFELLDGPKGPQAMNVYRDLQGMSQAV